MDPKTASSRHSVMKAVRRANTEPELLVRRYLHARGLRYRVNVKVLPGTPDMVFSRRRTVVFVHGCFWHGHDCPHGAVQSKTNRSFWEAKIRDNRLRDARKARALEEIGWHVETIWECQIRDSVHLNALYERIVENEAHCAAARS